MTCWSWKPIALRKSSRRRDWMGLHRQVLFVSSVHRLFISLLGVSLTGLLTYAYCIGLKDPLVDKEGYPRGDIDIMKVLEKRKRLSTINYDHKEVMMQIERLGSFISLRINRFYSVIYIYVVKEVHQEMIEENGIIPQVIARTHESVRTKESIAIIDEVFPESPAAEAGLIYGDQLISFGGVDSNYSGDPFTAIPSTYSLIECFITGSLILNFRRCKKQY